jgi:histidyl-tRNA synthetase
MARPRFQALPGTRDLFAPDTDRMRALVEVFAEEAENAGFGQIVSPMFEDLGVFTRIGESTDIVTKELYDFEDNGGRRVALRPEFTASL